MVFDLAALSLPWAGDASLHGDDNVIKYTIVTAIHMATIYCSNRLVILLDIRGVKTTVTIVQGRRAGCRRGQSALFSWPTAAT